MPTRRSPRVAVSTHSSVPSPGKSKLAKRIRVEDKTYAPDPADDDDDDFVDVQVPFSTFCFVLFIFYFILSELRFFFLVNFSCSY